MTTFPGSPKTLRGGLVLIGPSAGTVKRVITLAVQEFRSRSIALLRAAPVRFASPTTPRAVGAQAGRRLARSIQS